MDLQDVNDTGQLLWSVLESGKKDDDLWVDPAP